MQNEMQTILIVDDDEPLRQRLVKAMNKRGYMPFSAAGVQDALKVIQAQPLDFAVVDLRLSDGDGIAVVEALRASNKNCRAIMLSGYANIPTAVAAAKAGAIDFLPKPSDADDIEKALLAPKGEHAAPPDHAMSADAVRLAHINWAFEANGRNISETARQLRMHRRTLQRILSKQRAAARPSAEQDHDGGAPDRQS